MLNIQIVLILLAVLKEPGESRTLNRFFGRPPLNSQNDKFRPFIFSKEKASNSELYVAK